MLKTCPNPTEVQDLQFKLRCRLKVFDHTDSKSNFSHHCSLVTSASRFGLIFVGTNASNVQVVQLKSILGKTTNDGDYLRRTIPLLAPPTHLSTNCEQTVLSIILQRDGCPCALFYDIKSFYTQNIVKIGEVVLSSTPGVSALEVNWNPTLAPIFTTCKSDGTLGVYELKQPGFDINELPAGAQATCFCWSPKGKQIAVGSRNGKITQYKPDLKAVKVIDAPPLKEPHFLISLQWVSNYQFIGVFQACSSTQTSLIVIDAPKAGDVIYTNYDDICYSNGNARPVQYYMILQQIWNVLMVASSNSMEVGVLGNSGECWTQWAMEDASRAELPLSSDRQETFPIGCALDVANTEPLQWGETVFPPAPILLLFSHYGVLCCFNVVNLKEGIPPICITPEIIAEPTALQYFKSDENIKRDKQQQNMPAQSQIRQVQSIPPVQHTFKIQSTSTLQPIPDQPKTSIPLSFFNVQATTEKKTGLNLSTPQPVNLFGGQATLTPVAQGSKTPTQQPFTLAYQPLYPALPRSDAAPGAAISISRDSASTPTLITPLKTPLTTASQEPPGVPTSKSMSTVNTSKSSINVPKPAQLDLAEVLDKSDILNVDVKVDEESEALFAQMLQEERIFLESELKAVIHQGRSLKLNLGSDEDKTNIAQSTKVLQDFFKEVVENCTTQEAEVHILKQNVLQSWAWYEEVQSRHRASRDESVLFLLKAQPLDSLSEKQLADIRHADYYLESQIAQAHHALDEQWESFQDYCKKRHKMQIPVMEMIFQTMVKQNYILGRQKYVIKDIASRIKNKARSAQGPSPLISLSNMKELPDELKRLRMNDEDISQLQYEHVLNRNKTLSDKKVVALRTFLKKREYFRISAARPQLSTSIIQSSPSTKFRQLLTTSPVIKPKMLAMTVPTPKSTVALEPVSSHSSPMEGLQKFTLNFETENFNRSDTNFTPLTKNVISGSPNSAFVSASLGNTPTSSVLSFKPVVFSSASLSPSLIKTLPSYVTVTTVPSYATVTTVPSYVTVATVPSYVTVTTEVSSSQPVITISNLPKSTSFNVTASNTAPLFTSQEKFTSLPVTNLAKPPTFTFQNNDPKLVATATSALPNLGKNVSAVRTTASFFDIRSTSSVINLTSTPKAGSTITTNSTKPIVTSVSVFNSTMVATTSPSSFFSSSNVAPSNIFGNVNQNLNEPTAVVTEPKPFGFSSASANVSTPIVSSSAVSIFTATTPLSTTSITTTSTTVAKISSITQPMLFGASPSTAASEVVNSIVSNVATVNLPSPTSSLAQISTKLATPTTSTMPTTVQSSIFGSPIVSPSMQPVFSADVTKPGVFSSASSPFAANIVTTVPSAPFSATTTTSSAVTSTSAISPSSSVVFNAQATSPQQSIFGSSFSSNLLQSPAASSPSTTSTFTFGNTPTSKTSIFGGSDATTTQPSMFGRADVTQDKSPLFGNTAAPTTSPTAFGSMATSSTQPSMFGSTTESHQPLFGSGTSTTPNSSIFSSAVTTTQPQSFGVFGDTAQKPSSVFGTAVSTNSTQSSVFGGGNSSSVFGNAVATNSSFAQNQSIFDSVKPGQSVFGQNSGFGSPSTTTAFGRTSFGQSTGSLFGATPTTSTGNIFGGVPSTTSGFGSSGSIFGTPASSATPSAFHSGSVFSSNTGSFGFGNLNVGTAPTTSSAGFGTTPTSNPFGGDNKNVFGSSNPASGSVFGSSNTSIFGNASQSFGTGFGSQSPFSQQSTFGQNTYSNSFGAASQGPFSAASSGSVAQSGFGATSNFQKPSGFGSSPVFGSTPSFGSGPSFGGAPAFGNSSSFGSPSKIFGTGSTTFGVGSSNQNAGFGSLANQSTVGFGNLAQQASNTNTSNAPFSGNSSFSSWR